MMIIIFVALIIVVVVVVVVIIIISYYIAIVILIIYWPCYIAKHPQYSLPTSESPQRTLKQIKKMANNNR